MESIVVGCSVIAGSLDVASGNVSGVGSSNSAASSHVSALPHSASASDVAGLVGRCGLLDVARLVGGGCGLGNVSSLVTSGGCGRLSNVACLVGGGWGHVVGGGVGGACSHSAPLLHAGVGLVSAHSGGSSGDSLALDADILSPGLGGSRDVVVSLRVVHDLSLNGNVLNSLINSLNRLLNHNGFLNLAPNVLHLGLNGVVVSDGPLNGHSFVSDDFLVFDDLGFNGHLVDLLHLLVLDVLLLEGNVFNPAFNGDIGGDCLLAGHCGVAVGGLAGGVACISGVTSVGIASLPSRDIFIGGHGLLLLIGVVGVRGGSRDNVGGGGALAGSVGRGGVCVALGHIGVGGLLGHLHLGHGI